MKILVSHFGRQHVHELLIALEKKGWLGWFFTSLAAEKLPWRPQTWIKDLRKRTFSGVPGERIRHFPVLFGLERMSRLLGMRWSRWVGDWFDRRVARTLMQCNPDLVITYENTNRHTMRAAKRMGKTTVLDLAQIHHVDIVQYASWFMPEDQLQTEINIVNPRKTAALADTDYVLVLSSFAAESMLRNGWPAARLFTVNLGIDPQRFTLKKRYRQDGPLELLFVGTITRRKGLQVLFEALRLLHDDRLLLTLIGPIADGASLLRDYAGAFRHLPFLHHEQLVSYYQEADLFVFPSLLDSWAQTVLEAMACGTPAIVTENTGAKDAVGQGGGWIIPVNDAEALRDCLQYILNNRTEVETRGRLAYAIAQTYTWGHYHQQVSDALLEIARRVHPPLSDA